MVDFTIIVVCRCCWQFCDAEMISAEFNSLRHAVQFVVSLLCCRHSRVHPLNVSFVLDGDVANVFVLLLCYGLVCSQVASALNAAMVTSLALS